MPGNAKIEKHNTITTIIRTSLRARRVCLRVLPYPLRAELVLPKGYSRKRALGFLESKQAWIQERAGEFLPPIAFTPGVIISVLGEEITLMHTGSIRGLPRWEEGVLWISGAEGHSEARVKRALCQKLTTVIAEKVAHYAGLLGCHYQKITLRDTSSRWGSCSSSGNLSFCWKLVFAPAEVVDYVVAHEVAHLLELNHGPGFWQLVARLCPDFVRQRAWLKHHGLGLHRYGET